MISWRGVAKKRRAQELDEMTVKSSLGVATEQHSWRRGNHHFVAPTTEPSHCTKNFILATQCVRALPERCPRKTEGAGKAGCRLHPRSCAPKRTSGPQVQPDRSGFPRANGLRLTSRSPR